MKTLCAKAGLVSSLFLIGLSNGQANLPASTASATHRATAGAWDVRSDTWTATDALGRTLPTFAQVGSPRPNKFVGIFYFLWLGEHGNEGPFDISKILKQDPNAINQPMNPLWGPVGAPHHWGEPAFGYYVSSDEWVIRKHAQMLADAGVDTLIFDVTNQLTYPRSYGALCRVFSQIRREGGRTPQIAFLTPFWDPTRVARTLYNDLYKPGLYSDLWFRWRGKPLIMADPNLITPAALSQSQRVPGSLAAGGTFGQSFRATRPFTAVGGDFPTYHRTDAAVTLSLFKGGPGGLLLARNRFANLKDNATVLLEMPKPLPPGLYYLEQSQPKGQVGWWSETNDAYADGRAFENGVAAGGDRSLTIRYAGAQPLVLSPQARTETTADAAKLHREILSFFTFRKPRPDYFGGADGSADGGRPGEWGWLDVFPQKVFGKPGAPQVPEQMTVGVAQNAVEGKLSVLSNPRAHGRSFHDGQPPPPAAQDFTGRNFQEQWNRALQVDPEFVFVTGWNEWIAGRFNQDSTFSAMTPVSFVDQFDHEYSRDIEPVRGGHTDNYYYQLVANIRRFKGVRAPDRAGPPRTMNINGDFAKWRAVRPEFRDHRFDTTPRNHPGWGKAGTYKNSTGRNDFVRLKAAHDARNIYFYAQTARPITSWRSRDWMMLFLNTDGDARTGWQGFDFVINRRVMSATQTTLEAHSGGAGGWRWKRAATISYHVRGNQMELAIPRVALKLSAGRPLSLDFQWMDNVGAERDLLNLYSNGDAAPGGRFRYRYAMR